MVEIETPSGDFRLEKQPDRIWFPVYTKPNKEKKLQEYLNTNGIMNYLPLVKNIRLYRGQKLCSEIPMFRGYIFACTNPEETKRMKHSSHILKTFLTDEVSEELLLKDLKAVRHFELLAGEQEIEIKPELTPGKQVRITKGPFEGYFAVILRREGQSRIAVNLDFLGHSIVTMDIWNMELA